MKEAEQLVANIRELRFAIDRLPVGYEGEELQPTTRHALAAQAKALQADLERMLEELGEVGQAEAFERDLVAD